MKLKTELIGLFGNESIVKFKKALDNKTGDKNYSHSIFSRKKLPIDTIIKGRNFLLSIHELSNATFNCEIEGQELLNAATNVLNNPTDENYKSLKFCMINFKKKAIQDKNMKFAAGYSASVVFAACSAGLIASYTYLLTHIPLLTLLLVNSAWAPPLVLTLVGILVVFNTLMAFAGASYFLYSTVRFNNGSQIKEIDDFIDAITPESVKQVAVVNLSETGNGLDDEGIEHVNNSLFQ